MHVDGKMEQFQFGYNTQTCLLRMACGADRCAASSFMQEKGVPTANRCNATNSDRLCMQFCTDGPVGRKEHGESALQQSEYIRKPANVKGRMRTGSSPQSIW